MNTTDTRPEKTKKVPPKVEIDTDGITIWVNNDKGTCIARFGRMGIDIHNEEINSPTECLHCTHEPTTKKDWIIFQEKMIEHYEIVIPDNLIPTRFLKETA